MFGHHAQVTWSPADLAALGALVTALADDTRATTTPPLALVRKHGLGPMAFTHGLDAFRNDHLVASLRAEQQRAFAIEAVDVLAARGIPVALLKGISYAGTLYADPGERPMTDVDLLVPRADFDEAARALAALGYGHAGPAVQRSPRHHAMTLKRPQGGAIDLHRSPMQLGRIAIDHEGVWARSRPSAWIPRAFAVEPVDELLLHLANLARSDLIAPMRSFVDARRLLRKVDRAAAEARSRQWRFGRGFGLSVALVDHVTGAGPLPAWWIPGKPELYRGDHPPRALQIARKLLLGGTLGLSRAVLDGVIHARHEPPG